MAGPIRRKQSSQGPKRSPAGPARGYDGGRGERLASRGNGPPKRRPPKTNRPTRRPRAKPATTSEQEGERLQKVLAAAGLGSRRQCEELISTGRVEVDRQVVTLLGTRVDSAKQEIRVDGQSLSMGRRLYFAVHKPKGVVTTNYDPARRPRVVDLVPAARDNRLFAIGRLDLGSEGLILVTNDGELANLLTHPRYGIEKTYLAQVVGRPEPDVLAKLQQGVHLAEGVARAESVQIKAHQKESTWLEIVLREGRNREIRRMLARIGHKVVRLVRIAVGPIRLGRMPTGASRSLTAQEVKALLQTAKEAADHG